MQKLSSQTDWIARAQAVLPAGGFGNFDPGIMIARGSGSRVWDEDGNEYIDYLIGSGPMLLGHGHAEVMEAVLEQLPKGMTFFANNSKGVELAEAIVDAVPCCEQVRFVASGGEADMYAIRLARAYTGRNKILKFEGGYHGMSAEAQMSLAPAARVNFPQAVPDSAGIPQGVADQMLIAPYNDLAAVEALLTEHKDVAAIIAEPLQRIIPAQPGYLQGLRDLCDKHAVLLIFDEIVTGFRLAYGGAQAKSSAAASRLLPLARAPKSCSILTRRSSVLTNGLCNWEHCRATQSRQLLASKQWRFCAAKEAMTNCAPSANPCKTCRVMP